MIIGIPVYQEVDLLDVAGLLNGYKATTHWQFIPCLKHGIESTEQGIFFEKQGTSSKSWRARNLRTDTQSKVAGGA
jgi:hypothetical protein